MKDHIDPLGGYFHRKTQISTLQGQDSENLASTAFRCITLNKSEVNSLIQQTPWTCLPIYKTGNLPYQL